MKTTRRAPAPAPRRMRAPFARLAAPWLAIGAAVATSLCASAPASAHGFAGKRFFPATLATDDPFVADELSLPTIERRRTVDADGSTVATSASIDFTKRITSDFGIGFGASYLRQRPSGQPSRSGFDNASVNVKYQFYKSDAHETIASIGADADIGGSGSRRVGAESFSTVTPALFFGKGMGDLPDGVRYLRPLAITASAGLAVPTRAATSSIDDNGVVSRELNPRSAKLGVAIEYSLPYLQAFVKDVGLRPPFSHIVPLVELALDKPVDRGRGATTGTINPGFVIAGRTMQLGLEAVIPVNRHTGGSTGVLLQLHFFLDDLFPRSLGKPIFGRPG